MKWKTLDWLIFLIVIIILCYLVIFLNSESNQCMANPTSYGLKKLNDANNAHFSCLCTADKLNVPQIIITEKGITLSKNIDSYTDILSPIK